VTDPDSDPVSGRVENLMSACRRTRILAWKICAAALLCVPASASAQLVYKQFDDAGRIAYSDRPDAASPTPTATIPALDVARALARSTAMSSRGAAIIDANEAARRLSQAEHAQCPERLPDGQARSAGAIAAKDASCQARLRRAIEQAQRRVDKTSRLLRASR
jgi:hypothetical protein